MAQSGGPTAVINASLAGVIQEAGRHECIEEIFGGSNGILGVLNEDLIDINDQKAKTIAGLRYTPAAALGTCRYKIDFNKKPDQAARDMDRLFEVFQAHNIRYFFYLGGNDSQDTSHKIHDEAVKRAYDLRIIGVPKAIDNDLPHTDSCPGYGSVIKYNAATVMEVGLDVGGMATDDGSCCIVEVMGRSAGWIAAGSVLAKRAPADPPHIDKTRLDAFGHPILSGAAEELAEIVQGKLELKTRTVKLGYAQRAAAHFASATDADNAHACGVAAVKAAVEGQSGFMVKIVRDAGANGSIKWTTGLQPLGDIANVEHFIPRDWISEDGFLPNEKFVEYARPLIEGEVKFPLEGGLPKYVALDPARIEKKLPPRA